MKVIAFTWQHFDITFKSYQDVAKYLDLHDILELSILIQVTNFKIL